METRYQSAAEMAADLREVVVAAETRAAAQPAPREQARSSSQNALVGGLLVGLLALAAAIWLFLSR